MLAKCLALRQSFFYIFFHMELQKTLLTMLNVERERLGISVREWCRRAKLQQSTYYRWQNGETSATLSSLEKLNVALKNSQPVLK